MEVSSSGRTESLRGATARGTGPHQVVIGHVDAGKSTLMGHLLYDTGNVSQRIMHKHEQESKKLGKSSFMYAWVLDETGEERERGITMDVGSTRFETAKKEVRKSIPAQAFYTLPPPHQITTMTTISTGSRWRTIVSRPPTPRNGSTTVPKGNKVCPNFSPTIATSKKKTTMSWRLRRVAKARHTRGAIRR